MKLYNTYLFLATLVAISFLFSCNIEPYEGVISEDVVVLTCEKAIENTAEAGLAFSSATAENYAELCANYKAALETHIASCGDEEGIYQLIINGLDCESNGGGLPTAGDHTFMTANINGEQYNDMKPNGYLFFPGGVSVNGFFTRSDDDYLVMQGNSGYRNPTFIDVTDKEINLKIPSINWKEGTFVLYDDYNDIDEGVCHYTFFSYGRPNNIDKVDLLGEIIISKFSLSEKVIQGTFEFEYKLVNTDDNSEEGPFKVTGTFNYPLDDEFFD